MRGELFSRQTAINGSFQIYAPIVPPMLHADWQANAWIVNEIFGYVKTNSACADDGDFFANRFFMQ